MRGPITNRLLNRCWPCYRLFVTQYDSYFIARIYKKRPTSVRNRLDSAYHERTVFADEHHGDQQPNGAELMLRVLFHPLQYVMLYLGCH